MVDPEGKMRLDAEACASLDRLQCTEWLETDGLGNYAAGTLSGINTRRYHGLLVAEGAPNCGRRVLCAKLEETLFVDGRRIELSANQYPNTIHPQGYRYLVEFRLDPWPVWVYELPGVTLVKQVVMLREVATTVVTYEAVSASGSLALELRPLVAGRSVHSTAVENWNFSRQSQSSVGRLEMAPYDEGSRVVLTCPGGRFESDGFWFYNFIYGRDAERGREESEDLFNPGLILYTLRPGRQAVLAASPAPLFVDDFAQALDIERERRAERVAAAGGEPLLERLLLNADAHTVDRGGRLGVVAGYPWLDERPRDTLIALPGLTLGCGRLDLAAALLDAAIGGIESAAATAQDVDSAFWLGWAAREYLRAGGSPELVTDRVAPALADVVTQCQTGQRPALRVDEDGLPAVLEPGLTWMDSWVDGRPATPRVGKPVEVGALWHLTLRLLAEWRRDHALEAEAERVAESFRRRFWSEERGWLADVVDGPGGDDAACRPNQILAVSLEPTLLPDDVARRVTEAVTERLLTPRGLRSLAAGEPGYRAAIAGTWRERAAAWHRGAAWPWLLGAYADALLRVCPDGTARAAALLAPFKADLARHAVGYLPEVYDAEGEQAPHGCLSYAASTAELLRIAQRVGRLAVPTA